MKLFYRMFLGIFAATIVIFSMFGTFLVDSSYRSALEREKESIFQENQMYHYAFLTAFENLPESGQTPENAAGVAKSVWSSMGDGDSVFILSDSEGKRLYQSNRFLSYECDNDLEPGQSVSRILVEEEEHFLEIKNCLKIGDVTYYTGRISNISHIYEERNRLIEQYKIAIVFVFLVAGIWSFCFSRSLTKPLHNLSEITGQFASGNYEIRAEQKGQDEVSELMKDFNEMADALQESMKALQLAAKKQEDFTAAFAHELKTPLTSIIGYSDMLRSMELSPAERAESANYIYQQGKRLERLAYKMMEMVGVEKSDSSFSVMDAKDLRKDLEKLVTPLLQEKEIDCMIEMESGRIEGDRDLLLSLLTNLVDNARKACSDRGRIRIKGQPLEEKYCFFVLDNGRGIPREELGRITEAFYMVDKSRSRKEGGAGIGLALCMKIIQLHHGEWQIESVEGQGTSVCVKIPLYSEGKDVR